MILFSSNKQHGLKPRTWAPRIEKQISNEDYYDRFKIYSKDDNCITGFGNVKVTAMSSHKKIFFGDSCS